MSISIRPANSYDLESVYSLISDLENNSVDKLSFVETYSQNLTDPNIFYLVAENNIKIIGFISIHVQHLLHHSKPTCEIQELIIDSNFRGSGIGSSLMTETEKIARKLNLEEIELTTNINRERAQSFYQNLDYTHTHNKFVKRL